MKQSAVERPAEGAAEGRRAVAATIVCTLPTPATAVPAKGCLQWAHHVAYGSCNFVVQQRTSKTTSGFRLSALYLVCDGLMSTDLSLFQLSLQSIESKVPPPPHLPDANPDCSTSHAALASSCWTSASSSDAKQGTALVRVKGSTLPYSPRLGLPQLCQSNGEALEVAMQPIISLIATAVEPAAQSQLLSAVGATPIALAMLEWRLQKVHEHSAPKSRKHPSEPSNMIKYISPTRRRRH